MTRSVAINQENVSVRVRLIDDSDGSPATTVTADSPATTGLELWYQRDNEAVVTDSGSAAMLSALTSAHGDWNFLHINDGYYRVDIPDAAFIEGAGGVLCGLRATDISGVAELIIIDPLVKFNGFADSVTATTTTFASPGPAVYQGDFIYAAEGTGAGQTRLIKSMSGLEATHDPWDINISATTTTVMVLPGDETMADGGVNCDATISSRSSHTQADVNTELDASLAEIGLDHLVGASVVGGDVTDNSIIARMVSASATADWDSFINTTDSLEAIRNRGDNAWTPGGALTVLSTTIVSPLTSQTNFALSEGSPDNDIYNEMLCIITDQSTSTQKSTVRVSDYTAAGQDLTLATTPEFTVALGDTIDIIAIHPQIVDILVDTNELQSDNVPGLITALNDITTSEVWAEVLGTSSLSASAILQICGGVCAGELSGAATTTVTIRNVEDTGTLIVATVDTDGNRSAIAITTPSD